MCVDLEIRLERRVLGDATAPATPAAANPPLLPPTPALPVLSLLLPLLLFMKPAKFPPELFRLISGIGELGREL